MTTNNLALFPKRHHHDDHMDGQPAEDRPSADPQELHRLLSHLVESISSAPRTSLYREIRLHNLRSERYELTDDLLVVLEERDGQYIANSYDTGQYGHGYSPDDAIQHLGSVIEDYYDLLLEDESRLGQNLQAHLRYLQSIIRERP